MDLSVFMEPFYISNFLIILIYPLTRALKVFRFNALDTEDELGLTRENSLFYTIIAFVVLKWMRRYSTSQFLGDVFFTIKLALITGYVMVDFRIAALYVCACLISWLLFKQPAFKGPNRITNLKTLADFQDLLGIDIKDEEEDVIEDINHKYEKKKKSKNSKEQKQQKKSTEQRMQYKEIKQTIICEFYVTWADTCAYTKEIWAEYSMKFTTDKLQFVSVDLQKIPRLADVYSINTSSMSRQLPTVILFENGEEILRFPPIDKKTRKIAKVLKYDKKEMAKYFDLDKRYLLTRDD